jgi:hypothetical protein
MITPKQLLIVIPLVYIVNSLLDNIEHFTSRDPVLDKLKEELSVLDPKFKNVELYEGNKSYTINKKKVFVCLKDEHGRYYNRNMLCYVVLHEYAHMLCKSIGHTEEFNEIFDHLLEKASRLGLYNPSIPPLTDYCGH